MEPTPEEAAEGIALVEVLASVLDRLVGSNAPLALSDPGQITKFHALKAPGITIFQYLERIHKYAACSNECFILSLIYIDRLIQRNNFLLTELNVHRVVITAILLAAKFFDDAYYNNAYYAKVGGVLVSEMNGLEVDFLFRINFTLHVTPVLFHKYREELLSHTNAPAVPTFNAPQLPREQQQQSVHHQRLHPPPGQYHHEIVQASASQQQEQQPQLASSDVIMHPSSTRANGSYNNSSNHNNDNRPSHITPSPPEMPGGRASRLPKRCSAQESAYQHQQQHHNDVKPHHGFHNHHHHEERRRDTAASWGPMAIAGMSGS